ncbi:SRPBCC family protein [uncultured Roseibium sp.]|uniref:SRPBCC family protein n=1 Tax=uncultured Roseibium sp. TaxID=1936171 RepID=UPI003747A0DE
MTRVYVSSVIPAPAANVWRRVRDFNGLPAVDALRCRKPDRTGPARRTRWGASATSP